MNHKWITPRLVIMNLLQYAIWGAYLISMGSYLANVGFGSNIGWFFSIQGIVSIFMPALVGMVADKFIPAQKVLSGCHFIAALFMLATGYYALSSGTDVSYIQLFTLYSISVAFYMPTIALSNSVAFSGLEGAGKDTVKSFPPIRVFGTVGFIISMHLVDLAGIQQSPMQFIVSGILGLVLAAYSLTLPNVPIKKTSSQSFAEATGLKAFSLFKDKQMAIFFVFCMLLGAALQITNAFANPFISQFVTMKEYANQYFVEHANILISISQMSETLCILLIPFFMKKFGIKKVMLISMFAWIFRFGFLGMGNPGFPGVILFILSMLVYGVAFDFFNISGSLYVNMKTTPDIKSSAQGLFMLMTNGLGATFGALGAQVIVNMFTHAEEYNGHWYTVGDWTTVWYIFAGYALLIGVLFAILFKEPKKGEEEVIEC